MPTLITDHADRSVGRLAGQLREGAVTHEALARIFADQVQEVENALIAILTEDAIDAAEGLQLDGIGAVLGELRAGKLDAVYRVFLKVRVLVNRSRGALSELIAIVDLLLPLVASTTAVATEYQPGTAVITIGGAASDDLSSEFLRVLKLAKSGGVKLILEFLSATPGATFSFYDDPTGDTFGDSSNPATGGTFASAMI